MTNQELATCVINNIPIKVAIINNSSLGMVRQWQTLFYNERYSNTDLHTTSSSRVPDFVKLADAYGCVGLRCETPEDVDATIEQGAWRSTTCPVVVDFVVHRDAMVWPMVPAGVSNDKIQVARERWPRCGTARRRLSMSKHTLSVLVENKPGVLARIAGAVLPPRLQHRLARGRPDRAPGGLADHRRRRRRGAAAGAGHQAAQQARRGAQGRRARAAAPRCSARSCSSRCAPTCRPARHVLETVQLFRAKVVDVATDAVDIEATGNARQARGAARGPRAVRHQGARPVRHGRHRPRRPLDHRPRPCASA